MTVKVPPLKVRCARCLQRLDVSDLPPFSGFSCPVCGAKLHVPKRFGRYLLEKRLATPSGRNGASLYLASDTALDRKCMIKTAPADGKAQLRQEAITAGSFGHYGIITVYDTGITGQDEYISMEYMDGGTLADAAVNLLPEEVMQQYLDCIADALVTLHSSGTAYCRIADYAVFTDSSGIAKLWDFSAARPGASEKELKRDIDDFSTLIQGVLLCPEWEVHRVPAMKKLLSRKCLFPAKSIFF